MSTEWEGVSFPGYDMLPTRSDRGIVWMCDGCGAFMREPASVPPDFELVMPKCEHSFPGYEMLPMGRIRPLPNETLNEYHMRVYGRPYPHESRWLGNMLVSEADAQLVGRPMQKGTT